MSFIRCALPTLCLLAIIASETSAQHQCAYDQTKWVYRQLDGAGVPIDSEPDGMPDPLVYNFYNDTQGFRDRIPDFSWAGYRRGSRLPNSDFLGLPVISVPVPNGPGLDDLDDIQAAIDLAATSPVQSNGFRAIVELQEGTYRIIPEDACVCSGQDLSGNSAHIAITTSGIILRGAVNPVTGENLTSIEAGPIMDQLSGLNWPCNHLIKVSGDDLGGSQLMSDRALLGTAVSIDDDPANDDYYVALGENHFRVTATASAMSVYGVGERVLIRIPFTTKFQNALSMNGLPEWDYPQQDFYMLRTITRLSGNETNGWAVEVDQPFLAPCDEQFLKNGEDGPTMYLFDDTGIVKNVGIENVTLVSHFDPQGPGHPDTNECHTPRGITIETAHDCWVKEVDGHHFYRSFVKTDRDTSDITVMGCKHFEPIGGASTNPSEVHRRYTFNMHGQNHLVYRCWSEDGRHDWKTDGPQASGIVFLECVSEEMRADQSPHNKASIGILYDRVLMTNPQVAKLKYDEWAMILGYQNFGGSTQHGWTSLTNVAWNCESRTENDGIPGLTGTDAVKATIVVDKPRHDNFNLKAWQNWAIGCLAKKKYGGKDQTGSSSNPCGCSIEGNFDSGHCTQKKADVRVNHPRSLYRAQLRDRLQQWDVSVTLPEHYLTTGSFAYFPADPDA